MRIVAWALMAVGLLLFAGALILQPRGVVESVWTGIATGFFTTGLIDLVLGVIRTKERRDEIARRSNLIAPLMFPGGKLGENLVDLVLVNHSAEVAVHVVLWANPSDEGGLIRRRAIERSHEWVVATFDDVLRYREEPDLLDTLPWMSARVPLEIPQIPPKSHPRVLVRAVPQDASENPAPALVELPIRVEWSVPGDPYRYSVEMRLYPAEQT